VVGESEPAEPESEEPEGVEVGVEVKVEAEVGVEEAIGDCT
jgi:hypothetical protein